MINSVMDGKQGDRNQDDEQQIQLLSEEERANNAPDVDFHVHHPQTFVNKYWKVLVITPLLVFILMLTYWVTSRATSQEKPQLQQGQISDKNSSASFGVPTKPPDVKVVIVNEPTTSAKTTSKPQAKFDLCHLSLYEFAQKQYEEYQLSPTKYSVMRSEDVSFEAHFNGITTNPGRDQTGEVLLQEYISRAGLSYGKSSFLTFVSTSHYAGLGLQHRVGDRDYTVCVVLPPECAGINIHLFSYGFSAYTALDMNIDEQIPRSIFSTTICPAQVDNFMPTGLGVCSHQDVTMKAGAWVQINGRWYWKSHVDHCHVPDMLESGWTFCSSKLHTTEYIGDEKVHSASYRMQQLFKEYSGAYVSRYTYTGSCSDISRWLMGLSTVTDKLTVAVIHCATDSLYTTHFFTFKSMITSMFLKAKEAKRLSPNLRFVFLLTEYSQMNAIQAAGMGRKNIFTSATVNSWVSEAAHLAGVEVFDDMYPRLIGRGHITGLDDAMANLLLYKICTLV